MGRLLPDRPQLSPERRAANRTENFRALVLVAAVIVIAILLHLTSVAQIAQALGVS